MEPHGRHSAAIWSFISSSASFRSPGGTIRTICRHLSANDARSLPDSATVQATSAPWSAELRVWNQGWDDLFAHLKMSDWIGIFVPLNIVTE